MARRCKTCKLLACECDPRRPAKSAAAWFYGTSFHNLSPLAGPVSTGPELAAPRIQVDGENPSVGAILTTGPSAEPWLSSHPFRVLSATGGSYCYCPSEASATEWAQRTGVTEIELSPRRALDPSERHEADEPGASTLYVVGREPTACQVALADAYGSSSGEI